MNVSEREIEIQLKRFREREATQAGVPLYHILTNDVIERIAHEQPTTNVELLGIKGMGPQKVKKYGSYILSLMEQKEKQEIQPSERSIYTAVERTTDEGVKKERVYSVAEFLDHFNLSFARKPLAIHGEIYDTVDRRGANIYFRIKDRQEEAVLQCYMRSSVEDRLGVTLESGTEIVVSGFLSAYKPSGRFSLTVTEFVVHGEGLLKKAYEELERRLSADGLFELSRKRSLPDTIRSIALITAQGSDAEKDFTTHVIARGIEIDRYDVRVEGLRSSDQVAEALGRANQSGTTYDVIVVTRGGGSLESLQSFNSERVARAIAGSRIPVISAIGHENDITIADLTADVRASTPTHAGKIISEQWNRYSVRLAEQGQYLMNSAQQFVSEYYRITERQELTLSGSLSKTLERSKLHLEQELRNVSRMAHRIFEHESQLKHILIQHGSRLVNRFDKAQTFLTSSLQQQQFRLTQYIDRAVSRLQSIEGILIASNPDRMLDRGYSIVEYNHSILTSTTQVKKGDSISIRMKDGTISSTVESVTSRVQ